MSTELHVEAVRLPPPAFHLPPVEEIRAHFPALERRHEGFPVAYFDGPGGTQVPRAVVDAMADYLYRHNANTYWAYPTSAETDALIIAARTALAEFVNGMPAEIAFGANMTTLTFHLARALGRELGPEGEIVVTELDHHANVAPWTRLALERGVTVRTVRMVPETGQLDWEDVERQITTRTQVLAIGAASNALGTITQVRRAVDLAHAVGAVVFVDAVHLAPHALVDVRQLGCDFLACSAYKFYGPHVGVLWGRYDLLAGLDVPKLLPAPDTPPEHLETGTQNHEGIVGAAAAVDWLASLATGTTRRERLAAAYGGLHARQSELFARLWNELDAEPRVRLYGPPPDPARDPADTGVARVPVRTPTLAFVVDGLPAVDVVQRLAGRGVFATHGDFYATTVAERLGHARDGLVRAGCACYTSAEEIDRLIDGVRSIARG